MLLINYSANLRQQFPYPVIDSVQQLMKNVQCDYFNEKRLRSTYYLYVNQSVAAILIQLETSVGLIPNLFLKATLKLDRLL